MSVKHADGGKLRLLFIARAYPPTLGGMENAAFQLARQFGELADATVISNNRGKKVLPLFLPYAVARGILLNRRKRFDAVHLADAMLAPAGLLLKKATGLPVTASVNGLDITWPPRAYQAIVPRALARLDGVMPISEATAAEVRSRTHGRVPINVVPLGVNPLAPASGPEAAAFRARFGVASEQRLLLTVSRLVRRKGGAWFAAEVLPRLGPGVAYVVVGEGPEREAILAAAAAAGVGGRVRLTGRLQERDLAAAYAAADLFVMPNVPVPGDMEGFGLVALEAASAGLPVVASRLEGICEAVREGQNGTLVPSLDAAAHAAAIETLLALPRGELRVIGRRAAEWTLAHCSWRRVAQRQLEVIDALVRAPLREAA